MTMLNPIQLFLFASLPLVPIADSLPKFDIARQCQFDGGSKVEQERCAQEEAAARDQLQPVWNQSSAADKASCVTETNIDGSPSYVELLTCLEMNRDVKSPPK
jgi:hypothetical protein